MKRGRPLREIETWVFDLDNTLYPHSCNLFAEVEARMAAFICAEAGVDAEAAHTLRRHYYQTHGSTLRGLMSERGVDPRRFLDYVHEIDMSRVAAAPALRAALAELPGRKLVFTNADHRYAKRVLDRLEIADQFEGLFDIHAADYLPKPDRATYARFLAQFAVEPTAAIMVEDIARNLVPAHELGMTTAWIPGGPEWTRAEPHAPHVHHVVTDLASWLAAVPKRASAG
jgi:putative hydrolase of the HAD superfamily